MIRTVGIVYAILERNTPTLHSGFTYGSPIHTGLSTVCEMIVSAYDVRCLLLAGAKPQTVCREEPVSVGSGWVSGLGGEVRDDSRRHRLCGTSLGYRGGGVARWCEPAWRGAGSVRRWRCRVMAARRRRGGDALDAWRRCGSGVAAACEGGTCRAQ